MAPKFSIIIPTYNVEQYIARALESCINQTFGDIEILVVDDRGCDKSVEIAKEYARLDSRIQILSNPSNLGTFASRLKGIKQARGLYVLMLDADDYLTPNACECLYQSIAPFISSCILDTQAPDIIHFKAIYAGDSTTSLIANILHKARYVLPTQWSAKPLKNAAIAYNFFLKSKHFPKFTLWDKCYKLSLLQCSLFYLQHIQTPLSKATDMLMFFVLANLAKSYVGIDSRLYVYCLNATSITQNPNAAPKRIQDMQKIATMLQTIATNLNTSYAAQIAQMLNAQLRSLIALESRFETSTKCQKGGGRLSRYVIPTLQANISSISARMLRLAQILESLAYLCAHYYVYIQFWQNQALSNISAITSQVPLKLGGLPNV